MKFSEMVTSSVLARALALAILAIVMVVAVLVGGYDLLIGRALPPEITTIVGSGIGFACALIGVNFGVVLQPMNKKPPTTTLTP